VTIRRAVVFVISTTTAALIAWAVGFYLPGRGESTASSTSATPTSAISVDTTWASTSTTSPAQGAPIRVSVQDDPAAIDIWSDDGMAMILPRSVASGHVPRTPAKPPGNGCVGLHGWARRLGGIDLETTRVRLIVQGDTDKAVIITSISAQILSVKPTPKTVGAACSSEGSAQPRTLSLDLDAANPSAVYRVAGRKSPFGFTLRKGETEVFDLEAHTSKREIIEWNILLKLTIAGEDREIEIQDRGAPFRTSDARPGKIYGWPVDWTDPTGAWRAAF
jgi:hypothetical protein